MRALPKIVLISNEESAFGDNKPNYDPPAKPQMHDIGIQCCFDPIWYKTVETQTDQTGNAYNIAFERTNNELPLPVRSGALASVNAEESKVKHDHSYAMQPPPHVIFPTYEDDSFNSISRRKCSDNNY